MNLLVKYVHVSRQQLTQLTVRAVVFLFLTVVSCTRTGNTTIESTAFKDSLEKKVYSRNFPADSVLLLLNSFTASKNYAGIYITSCELGNRYRAQSDFSNAIDYHQQSLNAALLLKDTIYIAQAYNNIGTNLRRIGVLPEASDYHYQALQITESFQDVNDKANQKNRVMALNGIGNIALSINDFTEAENKFREALKGEVTIESNLGQAINYANLGAIYQMRKQYDSAFYYYDLSMIKNQLIGSKLGIGLCHTHFGEIFEDQNEYQKAEDEYRKAYVVMDGMDDKWHWLVSCLAVSRINLKLDNFDEALRYLEKAKETAEEIRSPEHLSEVYALYEMYYSRIGKYRDALENNKLSVMYQDSILSIQKNNQVTDIRINYEREKNLKFIDQLNREREMQVRETRIILTASAAALLLLISLSVTLWYAFLQRTKKNKTLRKIDRVKSNFFTNITHEFRTPLTIILGHSRQLQNKKVPLEEEKYYLSAIEKQGEQMLRLVNQLLDITKISSGLDKPVWKNGNIVTFIGILIDRYRLFANDKNIFISFYPQSPLIEMDFVPNYITDIFQNLLSNAIKYTSNHGLVSVLITADEKDVKLKVTDNGVGISEDDFERIFDLFYQVPNSGDKQGSGIGLAFTKQLVEHMNGTIEVKSQLNKGSEFTVTLPLRTNEKVNIEKWEPGSDSPYNTSFSVDWKDESKACQSVFEEEVPHVDGKPSILLVEDNPDVLFYVQSLLKDEYNVIAAVDGVDGMEKALRLIPDIIITDAMMPRKDGLTLCKEVKSSTILNHIPVIVITAKTTSEDMLTGLKCGADVYIRKPFQPEELLIRISNLLEFIKVMKVKYMKAVLEEGSKEPMDANMIFLHNVTNLIFKKISNPNLGPQQIADSLNISPSQLNRKVNAISGFSSSAYILHVKIDYSKKLLAKRDKNIGEVAEACGFLDVSYFSRIFKKITGVTPTAYRNLPQ
ncbi:ATP-binding protein [Petrimonas sp.]|uniref:hybrid sensor histidine kinase/response regulator transcription factor n=1 Tax=Petrimonas sp. TaxID=2023866 RepID=UPI0030CF0651